MDDNDTASVTINIPVPRKYTTKQVHKRSTKKSQGVKIVRKPSEASLRKYSLQGDRPLPVSTFENDDLLYSYTLFFKKQNKLKHIQRLSIGIIEKYKIQYTDLRKRLHIDDPPDDVFAITDIDEDYFKSLNGRLLSQHIPMYKTLKSIFNQRLRLNHEIGCRRDCTLNIEVDYRNEEKIYHISTNRYMLNVKLFDQFISEDYKNSMIFLKRWEDLKVRVNEKILELEHLATEKFTIISKLIGLDYLYGVQQKYGRFLYYLSPPSWRSQNRDFAHSVEIEAKGFDIGASSEEDTFNIIFEKMHNECMSGLVKPPLYFKEPCNLMDIFETIEQQNLHHFTYVTHLAPHAKKLKEDYKIFKDMNTADSAMVLYMINKFQKLLDFAEEQETILRSKFFRVLNGIFYDSVGAPEVYKLQIHLEFCYEKIYIEKPSSMPIIAMAKALEDTYMSYSFKLDKVHSNKIKKASNQYIEVEKIKLRRAEIASRELRLFGRLERTLLRAFKPLASVESPVKPAQLRPQRAKRRPTSQIPKVIQRRSTQHELTEAEIEYLTLFTNWTEDEDPAKFIHFEKTEESH